MERLAKTCRHHGKVDHYVYHDKHGNRKTKCYICNTVSVQKRRDKLKRLAVEYLGGKCVCCGYTKTVAALEFHHKDPAKKDFGISAKGHTRSWERIRLELDKCMLVCANCHREIHSEIAQLAERPAVGDWK